MATNMLLRSAAIGIALTFITVGIAACGFPPTTAVDPDTPILEVETPEPAAPAVASGERPEPAADVTCNDLSNPAQLDPIFAVPVDLAPPTRTFEYVGASISDEWVIRQAGGVACQWSDPTGISTSEGRYLAGLDLRLFAASGPQWQTYSDAAGDGSDRRFQCDDYGICDFDSYANGWWLSLSAFNIDALPSPTASALRALTLPVFTSIASGVASLPAPDPGWAPPTPEIAFGGGCTGVITGSRLASALGLGFTVDAESFDYPYIAQAAGLSIGASTCRWVRASDGWDIATIEVLPGGAWAQQEAKAAMEANGGTVPTPAVSGVPAGATALYHHVDSSALDIVLGGSWIKITIASGSDFGSMSRDDALIAIAADIAAHA